MPIRTEMETRGERRDERRAREEIAREREYGHRANVGERARGNGGRARGRRMKKREGTRGKERRCDIERERKRGREGESGRNAREKARVGVTGGGSETAAYVF